MTSVVELEAEVAATRERLGATIDKIQDKLTVSGIVDEVMGQAGVPRLESGHDFVLGLLRRHPVPLMIAAAGIGFALYQMNRRRPRALPRYDEDLAEPLFPSAPLRVYDPDLPTRQAPGEIHDTRRVEA